MRNPSDGPPGGRRRLLQAAGAALLGLATPVFADSARSSPVDGDDGPGGPAAPSGLAPALEVPPLRRPDAPDWKQLLLAGERRLVLRRDGPVRSLRYGLPDGSLDHEGYLAACYLLRDVRAGRMARIDPHLLDVLCGIQRWMDFIGQRSTIEITSGYRTVRTNDSAEGAGRHSLHLLGKAADIVVPGASSRVIGDMVQRFNQDGGTGIYLGKGFVHVDTGAPRTWIAGPRPRRRRRAR